MIDVDRLLAPIAPDSPAGQSLRYEGVYDLIQAARREDDPALPQGIWQTALKKADWPAVRDICLDAIETRSKDLQLAAWLLEAFVHLNGFEGVRDGFKVLTGLCLNFWGDMYPELDSSDPEFRYAPIQWINEKVSLKLKQIPVTKPQNAEMPPYSWGAMESALHLESLAARDKNILTNAEKKGHVTQAKFLSAVNLTATDFYLDLSRQLNEANAAVLQFDTLLKSLETGEGATLHTFRENLTTIDHFVKDTLRQRGHGVETAPAGPEQVETTMIEQEETTTTGGRIRNRAQAYQMLSEAAEYLIRTEPHSPTPYLVKRAVSWGGMSLSEVLHQLMKNQGELNEIYKLLGIDEIPKR